MPRLQLPCPICEKPLVLIETETIGDEILQSFKCGHAFTKTVLPEIDTETLDFTSVDGSKQAREYQKKGVEFAINSGFACVIGDQMRLGKTPQSLLAVKNHPDFNSDDFKVLILVRAANLWQWVRETRTWADALPNAVWTIQGTKNWIPDGFKFYICSMDTFGRKGMSDQLLKFGFKVVIADEAHSFKNADSQRSQALVAFLKEIERSELEQTWTFSCPFDGERWDEIVTIKVSTAEHTKKTTKTSFCPKCYSQVSQSAATHIKVKRNCGIVMLTGTPIKNRADEYFVPLNLIAPEHFPSIEQFRRSWLQQDSKGKWSRVHPYRIEAFKQLIAPFVLRREKEDVYTDTPKLNRMFTVIEVTDERLKKAYNQVLDKLELQMADKSNFSFFDNIGELQQLRQICGLAKVNWIADYSESMLMDSDKQKLAIGIHHHSVRDALSYQLSNLGCLKLSGEDSPIRKDQIMRQFETSPEQILIINMLAGGVGMDFHYCDNVLVAERQWNSADEEQFEFRFYNPDKSIKDRPTNVEYVIAKGTIDSFFYELVEEKRKIFGETIGTNWSLQEDSASFKELLERTVAGRL